MMFKNALILNILILVFITTRITSRRVSPRIKNDFPVNPEIYSMEIRTKISNRFATTLVTSKVRNIEKTARETTFSMILPENAFISEFTMEIDGKEHKAYVREKEEAKKLYKMAVSRKQSAARIELTVRDSKNFQIYVNIEPESEIVFRLTYEELLQRQNGQYELVINIFPNQIVDNLNVEIYITESRRLTFVRTPPLRTGHGISKNEENLDPSADIEIFNSTSAVVKFHLDKNRQKTFANLFGTKQKNGFAGQFIVQYDVERDLNGEVLIHDGYFVHFFSPSNLEPLPKQVVFVLDHSVSMMGRKIAQLTDAMQRILADLKINDVFSIIRFNTGVLVWNPNSNKFETVNLNSQNYGNLERRLKNLHLPNAVQANFENIEKAKKVVKDHKKLGATNIIAGLEVALFLVKRTQQQFPKKYQPMIIFLTDGLPNGGISSTDQITDIVTRINSGENRASIFSLSFGNDADKAFLRKLSLRNLGFSKHIYEASDASLQLQDFYREISSPLLSNVTFKYVGDVTNVTKTHYPLYFSGSELVVAGQSNDVDDIPVNVDGTCNKGPIQYIPTTEKSIGSIERLWAYLTVQQLLKERDNAIDPKNLTAKALNLALKYSFVTDVTSLLVVKPNQPEVIEVENTSSVSKEKNNSNRHPRRKGFIPVIGARIGFEAEEAPTVPALTDNSTVPEWLEELESNNQAITTSEGSFQLYDYEDVVSNPNCTTTPMGSRGECKFIFDCPQVFPLLPDLDTYLEYFCPLNEYAGVCCPVSTISET